MKKLMFAVAGAVAIGFSAVAAEAQTWFNGGIGASWPNATTGGAWDNVDEASAELVNNVVEFDAEDSAPLKFNATNSQTIDDNAAIVTFTTEVDFTPFTTLPSVPDGAKAGAIVYNGYYYVLAKDGDANVWTATGIESTDASILLTVTINKDVDGVSYKFGDNDPIVKEIVIANKEFTGVDYMGSGSIASLSATAVANLVDFTLPSLTGATIESVTIGGATVESPYTGKPGAALVVVYKAEDGKLFKDGTDTYTFNGTVAAGEIDTGVANQGLTDAPAAIGTQLYYTLKDAFDAVKANETVVLMQDTDVAAEYTGTVNFTLDINGKNITSATVDATIKNNGTGTMTIVDSVGTGKVSNSMNEDGSGIAVYSRLGAIIINSGNFENNTKYEATAVAGHANLTINGGTFTNLSEEKYPWGNFYHLALNRVNSWEGVLTVYGGTFSSDPSKGDDSENPPTFVASGYAANKSGDNWVVEPMLQYYAEVFIDDETTASETAYLGEGDHYYGKGVKVPASKSGVQTFNEKTYYVSKLVLKGGDDCTFTYNGTALTKVSGDLDVTIDADGTTLSYEVTTGENACFAEIYLTEYIAGTTFTIAYGTDVTGSQDAGDVLIKPGESLTITLSNSTLVVPVFKVNDTVISGKTYTINYAETGSTYTFTVVEGGTMPADDPAAQQAAKSAIVDNVETPAEGKTLEETKNMVSANVDAAIANGVTASEIASYIASNSDTVDSAAVATTEYLSSSVALNTTQLIDDNTTVELVKDSSTALFDATAGLTFKIEVTPKDETAQVLEVTAAKLAPYMKVCTTFGTWNDVQATDLTITGSKVQVKPGDLNGYVKIIIGKDSAE